MVEIVMVQLELVKGCVHRNGSQGKVKGLLAVREYTAGTDQAHLGPI